MGQTMFQKIVKMISAIIIFSAVAFLGYIAGGVVKYNIDIGKADKTVERFQESLEEPYKKDTYGGKTPEETWAMYLDALRKGDYNPAHNLTFLQRCFTLFARWDNLIYKNV